MAEMTTAAILASIATMILVSIKLGCMVIDVILCGMGTSPKPTLSSAKSVGNALISGPFSQEVGKLDKMRASNEKVGKLVQLLKSKALPVATQMHAEEKIENFAERLLSARKQSVEDALGLAESDARWRLELDVARIAKTSDPSDLLEDFDASVVQNFLPHFLHGHDKLGRPVIYKHMGEEFRIGKLLAKVSQASLVRYNVWLNERLTQELAACSKIADRCISQWTIVIDAQGGGLAQGSTSALRFLKEMADMDQNHYFERLGGLVVLNAPYVAMVAWRVIRTWLDPVTREKVQICASAETWKPVLSKLISEHQIPVMYGGAAVGPCTPEERAQTLLQLCARSAGESKSLGASMDSRVSTASGSGHPKTLRSPWIRRICGSW